MGQLVAQLDAIPGLESRHVGPFDYRGRGKLLDSERPTRSDLDGIAEPASRCLNRKALGPESEWIQHIVSGELPEKTRRYYMVPISEETIPQLRSERPETVLAAIAKADDTLRDQLPPLCELANSYGDTHGARAYALRDLEWKWTDAYLAGHPGVNCSGVFDDRRPCALCK